MVGGDGVIISLLHLPTALPEEAAPTGWLNLHNKLNNKSPQYSGYYTTTLKENIKRKKEKTQP